MTEPPRPPIDVGRARPGVRQGPHAREEGGVGAPPGPPKAVEISERLGLVRERIAAAGADPTEVTVVAVTKGHGPEAAEAALAAGIVDLGENYAGELLRKHEVAGGRPPAPRWHFLGHVQRRKVRSIAGVVHLWQGVDREAAGAEIARRAPGAAVLVQVNVTGEAAKNGCRPDEAATLVDELRGLDLRVLGLMAMGPAGPPEAARPGFRQLAALADELGLAERSMGMSDDLEVAVQEGATMVRIGRALFGPRSTVPDLRR
ncbi:MAG TPA: YggS family pyridoxal phosphate-dependent enzyme [Acidimicrobiales bacterium]|nr:YggS family pyridoxal phosphate-dependent enzyme [Acidimicrobiales bacterium]